MFCNNSLEEKEENFSNNFFNNPEIILGTTNLTNQQKILYRRRFMNKLHSIRTQKHLFAVLYYIYKFFSTTLGVAIPALLSIQYYYNAADGINNPIYWSAWGLSLLGGFINGYTHIFKVEERFFLLRTIYQKMKYECWSFLLLCKKYEIKMDEEKLTHNQLFTMFMESIEIIINEYKKNDMEALFEDNKRKEDELIEMQQRTITFQLKNKNELITPPPPPDLLSTSNTNNMNILRC